MDSIPAIALLLFVAVATPGPNNFIVLRIATAHGVRAALPAVFGITLGGVFMLAVAALGLGELLQRLPAVRVAIMLGGGAMLAAAGLRLMFAKVDAARTQPTPQTARGEIIGLLAFQFMNVKAWVMVLAVVASVLPASAPTAATNGTLAATFLLFVVIPVPCLLSWALAGKLIANWLITARRRALMDRAMGAVLTISACLLTTPLWTGTFPP